MSPLSFVAHASRRANRRHPSLDDGSLVAAHSGPEHDRPCWDQSSVLDAVLPDRGFFGLSSPGRVAFDANGRTRFTVAPDGRGRDRHLVLDATRSARALEAIACLTSQPPVRSAEQR